MWLWVRSVAVTVGHGVGETHGRARVGLAPPDGRHVTGGSLGRVYGGLQGLH